jgi:hypothetical protein
MSAIASFLRLSEDDLSGLRDVAALEKLAPGSSRDEFSDYLRVRSEQVIVFAGAGYVFGTVLPYLEERHGIDLLRSRHDELVNFLSASREAFFLVLTRDQQAAYLDKLRATAFDTSSLAAYYNEFNETDEPDAGKAMAAGIDALKTALAAVHTDSVVLMQVG